MERIARKLEWSRSFGMAAVVTVALALVACQPLEKTARDTIATEQGFLNKAEENHLAECQAPAAAGKALCVAIKKAGLARNVAIDALELFCAGQPRPGQAAFGDGGPCSPRPAAAAQLRAALADLERNISDVKAVLQ